MPRDSQTQLFQFHLARTNQRKYSFWFIISFVISLCCIHHSQSRHILPEPTLFKCCSSQYVSLWQADKRFDFGCRHHGMPFLPVPACCFSYQGVGVEDEFCILSTPPAFSSSSVANLGPMPLTNPSNQNRALSSDQLSKDRAL